MNEAYKTKPTTSELVRLLGFAGLLPFIIPVVLMVQGAMSAKGFQSAAIVGLYAPYVFVTYSAVILSFLCGALWGKTASVKYRQTTNAVFIFSNLIALCAWSSTLLIYIAPIMTIFAVALLLAGFLSVLWFERMAFVGEHTDDQYLQGYWQMRLQLTAIVALLHLIVIYLMIQEL